MFKIIDTLKKALKVEKPSENDKDLANNILTWDSYKGINDYANIVLKAITNSPTASACISTKIDYVRGGGFNIPELESLKVNKDEKFNSFHNGLSETITKLRGIAIHVQRDVEGNIVQLTKMPFEDFRLGIPDEDGNVNYVVYNPRWQDRDFKISENVKYDLYTSSPVTYQKRFNEFRQNNYGKKYKGEIYWNFIKRDGFPYYPYSFSEFDIKAFETDSSFTDFDYNNIHNNFFLGGVMNIWGDPNEQITEQYQTTENGETVWKDRVIGTRGEIFNREMQDNFGGGENTGKMMVNWMQNAEQKLDIEAFPINTNSDLFQQTQARIWNKIALITKVPNVLANIETAGKLGNSQEILNAIQLINNSVNIEQSLLEEAYNELLPKHIVFKAMVGEEDINIKKLNPVSFLPTEVWEIIPDKAKLDYVRDNYDIEIEEIETPQQNREEDGKL